MSTSRPTVADVGSTFWEDEITVNQQEVTAIDLLLEPDLTMIQPAADANARLLALFPKGFALDEVHRPHITVLQRYVHTNDLDTVYAAAASVLADTPLAEMQLTAFRYYYIGWNDIGLAGIVVEPTAELHRLQQRLIDAVMPFTADTATADAFITTPQDPEINQPTIDYVAGFVSLGAGTNYNPHVTVGMALKDDLDEMLAETFTPFTFGVVGAAAYQLGNFGTASKLLRSWTLDG